MVVSLLLALVARLHAGAEVEVGLLVTDVRGAAVENALVQAWDGPDRRFPDDGLTELIEGVQPPVERPKCYFFRKSRTPTSPPDRRTRSDGQGWATLLLPPGDHLLRVDHAEDDTSSRFIQFSAAAGQERLELDVRMLPRGTVTGRVLGGAGGRPIPNAHVVLLETAAGPHFPARPPVVVSDEEGRFRFEVDTPFLGELHAFHKKGWRTSATSVSVLPGAEVELRGGSLEVRSAVTSCSTAWAAASSSCATRSTPRSCSSARPFDRVLRQGQDSCLPTRPRRSSRNPPRFRRPGWAPPARWVARRRGRRAQSGPMRPGSGPTR